MLFKNAIILITFILNITSIFSLSLPFYSNKNLNNATTILEILDFFRNNEIYSYIEIGDPSQTLPFIITSYDSSSTIKQTACPISSSFDISNSQTVQKYYNEMNYRYYSIKDFISFDNNNKNIFMNFIYYNQTDENDKGCGFIGIQNLEKDQRNDTNNIIIQLKNLSLIDKAIFYFNYTGNNSGFLNIGVEPFEFNSYLYSKNNMKKTGIDPILDYEIKTDTRGKFRWNLNITKVFYFQNLPIESKRDPYVEVSRKKRRKVDNFQALLEPDDYLIKGPYEYQEVIEEDFFDTLISENMCKRIIHEGKYYFVCQKEYKSILKKAFPTIYFYSNTLKYMFQLTYDDLFIEKDEHLIFAIYFDYLQIEVFKDAFLSEWHFGKVFLKKYCFSFDLDNEQLIFYKENIIRPKINKPLEQNKENGTIKRLYQFGLILIVIAIGILAFILERLVKRKNRISNTLIDYENK